MAAIPATTGEVFELKIIGRQESQDVINVLHFRARTDVDDIQVRLLQAILTCILTNLIPIMGSNYQLQRLVAKRVMPTLGAEVELVPAANAQVQGDADGDTQPSFVSALVTIRCLRAGRSGRGRFFVGGIPEGATAGSYLITENAFWLGLVAFVACVASTFVKANEPLGLNQMEIGVVSRKIGGAKPPYVGDAFSPAFQMKAVTKLASTVSRKVGHGK